MSIEKGTKYKERISLDKLNLLIIYKNVFRLYQMP